MKALLFLIIHLIIAASIMRPSLSVAACQDPFTYYAHLFSNLHSDREYFLEKLQKIGLVTTTSLDKPSFAKIDFEHMVNYMLEDYEGGLANALRLGDVEKVLFATPKADYDTEGFTRHVYTWLLGLRDRSELFPNAYFAMESDPFVLMNTRMITEAMDRVDASLKGGYFPPDDHGAATPQEENYWQAKWHRVQSLYQLAALPYVTRSEFVENYAISTYSTLQFVEYCQEISERFRGGAFGVALYNPQFLATPLP